MKRILLLVPSLGMGGMERVCINYANIFVNHGYEVYLYNLTFDDNMIINELSNKVVYKKNLLACVPNIKNAKFKDVVSGKFRFSTFENWAKKENPSRLYKKLITTRPDMFDIEIAFYGGNIMRIISGSCQRNSIKLGWIHASTIESHFHLFRNKENAVQTYRSMDALICVSNVIKDRALELFGKDTNAYVLYNPQNVSRIRRMAVELVEDIDKKNKITFINASRLDINHKGFDRLVSAIKKLNDDGYEFELWILGNGKDRKQVQQLIEENNVNNVKLLGERQNPYKYMNLCDCYICSSRFEGYSMVVAEAILLGLPVISTDVSGAREMLGDSQYGLVVENSEAGIYEGLRTFLSNADIRQWIKEQAEVHKNFLNESVIFAEFERILQLLV